jgi:Rrf2 family protein
MAPLRTAGLVESHQGKGGGFSLSRPPEDITLEEVYRAFEGSPAPVQCLENGGACSLQRVCPSRETWEEIREAILGVLRDTTLRDLGDRLEERSSAPPMYHI